MKKSTSGPGRFGAAVLAAAGLWFAAGMILPASGGGEEFHVIPLGDQAAIFQTGRESITNTLALAGRRGLVIIDTGVLPSRGPILRAAVEKHFGRKDFAYVINTHSHYDHVAGNQAFADVPIVAHQNAIREMTRGYQGPEAIRAFLQGRERYRAGLEAELKTAAGTKDEARLREQIAEEQAIAKEYRSDRFLLTLPTIVFTDRMTIELGDLTLNLVYFGVSHTESHILVHASPIGLLAAGDLFSKSWLPTFGGRNSDVPRWFRALDFLPAGDQAVRTVVTGHEGPMTGVEFRTQVAYLRTIWDGVAAARREGATLAATRNRFPFEKRFPGLAGLIRESDGRDHHALNIENAWRLQSDSAAAALEALISARGAEQAVADYLKTIARNDRYSAEEAELNALGYRYLRAGKTAEAIAVFEINAGTFPGSWNVWDSLAEAYESKGDRDKAEIHYAKSVELNPGNRNGKDNLSRLRGYKLDQAGETKETLRFPPGAKTGRNQPYLGQTPPGTTPQVFAPGIVSAAAGIEFAITFSPDGREIYFTRRIDGGRNTLMVCRWEKDGWTAPEAAAFTKDFPANEPHVTPDGRRLYFGCWRPKPGTEQPAYGIWVVERTADGGWGEPRYHGEGMYVSVARNGNLYMMDFAGSPGPGLALYPWADGRYGPPRRLGEAVNSPREAVHAHIAPDESRLLFDSYNRPGAQGGEGDLFICFKNPDGSWGEAMNLGAAVNTPATNFCPSISPDGKYIFYTTYRDIYWVSAKILDELKAKSAKDGRSGEESRGVRDK